MLRPAVYKARAVWRGRAEMKNIDLLESGMSALDRVDLRVKELWAQDTVAGNAQAAILWFYTWGKWGYRIAKTWDVFQGTPVQAQELVLNANKALTEMGKNPAERLLLVDEIIGDAKLEWPEAAAQVHREAALAGLTLTANQLQEKTADRILLLQRERARARGLRVDDFEEQGQLLAEQTSWNLPETRGPGALIAATAKGAQQLVGALGLPLPLAAFGNAIGTTVSRTLHRTPLMFLTNIGMPSSPPSPWHRTERDRQQRRAEALVWSTLGIMAVFPLAALGLLRVPSPPRDKEEREIWEREGHVRGTIEIPTGEKTFIPISGTTGPLAPLWPYFAAGGALHRLFLDRGKAQDKLNAEALAKGEQPGEIRPIDTADVLGVIGSAAWTAIIGGGRTSSGLFASMTDYSGIPNATKFLASQVAPNVPMLPMLQGLSRMAGVRLDHKLASFADYLLPLPTSGALQVNLLGEPAGTHDALQRITQSFTGGTFPGIVDPRSTPAYEVLTASGYRPPSINSNKGYSINGQFRPMTDDELVRYTQARGDNLRQALIPLGANADIDSVRDAYSSANRAALRSVGAQVEEPSSGSSLNLRSPSQGGALGGTALRSSYSSRRPSARFRTSRSSGLRRGRRPRLARGRTGRTTRLSRSRGIRRLSRGIRLRA